MPGGKLFSRAGGCGPLIFILAASLAVATACAGRPSTLETRRMLPPEISVGQIEGPGGPALARALSNQAGTGRGKLVLEGRSALETRVLDRRELVPTVEPAGAAVEEYVPDPFTGRLWKEDVVPTMTENLEYPLEEVRAVLSFDWRLVEQGGGRVAETGRICRDLTRGYGGYPAALGQSPPLGRAGAELSADLAKSLADGLAADLALRLGAGVRPEALESGQGPESRRARELAAQGDWDRAKGIWEDLLRQNPRYAPALYNLGLYYDRGRDAQKAHQYYREAFLSDASALHRQALTDSVRRMSGQGATCALSSAGSAAPE